MSNLCQPCGQRGVSPLQWRTIWLNPGKEGEVYIEWNMTHAECGDKVFCTLTHAKTGEIKEFSPNQLWIELGGNPEEPGAIWG